MTRLKYQLFLACVAAFGMRCSRPSPVEQAEKKDPDLLYKKELGISIQKPAKND